MEAGLLNSVGKGNREGGKMENHHDVEGEESDLRAAGESESYNVGRKGI